MKKCLLAFVLALIFTSGFPQRFEVVTSDPAIPFKRHYSWSIEGGSVDNQPRQVVAGNQTDWVVNSKDIKGNAINGTTFMAGRGVELTNETANIMLTDFIITPEGGNSQYAAGTGIYFPAGPAGMGYVYLGIYERGTMQLTTLVYFDLLYSGEERPRNTAGTRIKYAERENAFYISGIMIDRTFTGMNINNPDCYSQGFILKVSPPYNQANVVIFNPDPLADPRLGRLCSVNDIQISPDGNFIAFTGVTTEDEFTGYYQPMAGKVDMNLNPVWCNAYELREFRYSGIDVELGAADESMFILCNSEERPFTIMELGVNGMILQTPEKYTFGIPACNNPISDELPATARAHMMHYTESGGLIVTGNSFIVNDLGDQYQSLFRYNIPVASDLGGGDPLFGTYSCDLVPLGSQIALTSWWAPENSLYRDGNLYIVGSYNPNDGVNYGYNYIDVNGFDITDPHCYLVGTVRIEDQKTRQLKRGAAESITYAHEMGSLVYTWQPEPNQECPPADSKPDLKIEGNSLDGDPIWKYTGTDDGGIHAILYSGKACRIQVIVYDVTGRKVFSAGYDVAGQKEVYLQFNTANRVYLVSVDNGIKLETQKVLDIK